VLQYQSNQNLSWSGGTADAADFKKISREEYIMKLTVKKVYKCETDGRWRAYCVDENGKPHIVSYPRILMEEKLGRPLEPNEDVHHKDENIDNNDITNLEVQMHGLHQKQHSTKYVDTVEVCMICGNKFTMKASKWAKLYADLNRTEKKSRVLTCSKSCAGKASSGKYTYLYDLDSRLSEVEQLWIK